MKGQINHITSTLLVKFIKQRLIFNTLSVNIEDSISMKGNPKNSRSAPSQSNEDSQKNFTLIDIAANHFIIQL